ncbi:hypothetical protein DYB37_011021 [Aphanomyces astaci]|uniref:HSF-type DNA-binding domain-containing protein n=1 Tax=Aphanomyces astaci TaxID=112090 RepID=A0A397DII5_APHAT|nr:hypothetical protein DYB36_007152 [Aphanomyces astaci]RHY37734.1 hypothetical protein DYB25_006347 [Aphanomyces astaci]RHY38909.1 hypothetical protein DYB30_005927 [Aphanomyces astaci]RHY56241.1 hypothetical protein DYB34_008877 [Aphanomyces astaci]RHY62909.1 hypothetical protein DYB38_006775 [Aphanomyces astaci]
MSPSTSKVLNHATPPFLASLFEILSKEDSSVIGWCDAGRSFGVYDFEAMEKHILPTYFRHNKFASFQRQLNYFGFRKLQKSNGTDQSNVYCQPLFNRDDPSAMLRIKRKTYRLKSSPGPMSPRDGFPYSPSRNTAAFAPYPATDVPYQRMDHPFVDMCATPLLFHGDATSCGPSFTSLLFGNMPSGSEAIDVGSFQPIPFHCLPQDSWTLPDEDLTLLSTLAMPIVVV